MRHAIFLTVGLMVLAAAQQTAQAVDANSVQVELADGRSVRGVVDSRSDDMQLWVRQEEGAVVLATAVAWSEVSTATLGGTEIDVAELKKRGGEAATVGPRLAEAKVSEAVGTGALSGRPLVHGATKRSRRVRSVEIVDAYLVNLDRDVEADGLLVSIAAIDDAGAPVVVRGNFTARLYAERRPAHFTEVEFAVRDDWSQPVEASDFVEGLATYELRFRKTAPEWQFDLLPDAVLEVRLGAYREGNFAASAPVIIREFNPLRDNRQGFYGTRFLPRELHGRVPASNPMRRDGLWMHWAR